MVPGTFSPPLALLFNFQKCLWDSFEAQWHVGNQDDFRDTILHFQHVSLSVDLIIVIYFYSQEGAGSLMSFKEKIVLRLQNILMVTLELTELKTKHAIKN